jgi:hypothetical protein
VLKTSFTEMLAAAEQTALTNGGER